MANKKKIRHYYIETTDQEQAILPTFREVKIVCEPQDRTKPYSVQLVEGPLKGRVLPDVPWTMLCKRNGSPLA